MSVNKRKLRIKIIRLVLRRFCNASPKIRINLEIISVMSIPYPYEYPICLTHKLL